MLVALLLAFLGYPLLRGRWRELGERSAEEERLETLLMSRDSAYSALKELEFDREIGNLSEGDYRALDERYKARAISLLKNIDALEKGDSLEERLEGEVLKLRGARSPALEERIEGEVLKLRQAGSPAVRFCSQCGQRVKAGDRFCSGCGARLSEGGSQ